MPHVLSIYTTVLASTLIIISSMTGYAKFQFVTFLDLHSAIRKPCGVQLLSPRIAAASSTYRTSNNKYYPLKMLALLDTNNRLSKQLILHATQLNKSAAEIAGTTEKVINSNVTNGLAWKKAFDILEESQSLGINPETLSYNAALNSLAREGNCNNALKILQEMKQSSVIPDLLTYTLVMTACERAQRSKEVYELFTEMQQNKIYPDLSIYIIVLNSLMHGGSAIDAIAVFETIKKDIFIQHIPQPMYETIISICTKGRLWSNALNYFNDMVKAGNTPTDSSLMNALIVCNNTLQWDLAMEIFIKYKCNLENQRNKSLWSYMLTICRNSRNIEFGKKIWKEFADCMPGVENDLDLCFNYMSILSLGNDPKLAESFFMQIQKGLNKQNRNSFMTLVADCYRRNFKA